MSSNAIELPPARGPLGTGSTPQPSARPSSHRRRRGAALTLAIVAMATVSFNLTRVGGWTVSDLLFASTGGVVILKLLRDDQRYLTPRRYRGGSQIVLAGLLVVIIGATISSFGSWSPLASMMVIIRLIWSSLVLFWILRSVCRDRTAFEMLMKAWRFTVLASTVAALLGKYVGVQFNPSDFGQGRQAGLTFHPGELMNFLIAGFFLFAIPLFVPTSARSRQLSSFWWFLGTGLVVLAIFATGSTSGLLAIGAGGVAVLAAVAYAGRSGLRRRRTPLVTMTIVVLTCVGAVALMSSDLAIAERLTGLGDGSSNLDDSVESRNEVYDAILADFDRYLVVGVGPTFFGGAAESFVESATPTPEGYGNVHNMHLKLLYESGLPAVLGLWLIIYAVGRQAVRLVIATRGTALYRSSLMLLGAFVAVNTSSMFGPTAYARHFWLPFAMIGCLWSVRRHELDGRAREGNDAPVRNVGASSPHAPVS